MREFVGHVRSLGLSHSASEKMAKLLLEWCERNGKPSDKGLQLKLTLTHEEIAQIIGSSRETVTRLFGEFKNKQYIYVKGSTLIIRNKPALALVIADIGLPDMDGHALVREMRRLRPAVKIIMATGSVTGTSSAEDDGANVIYLGKPYQLADLKRAIERLRS